MKVCTALRIQLISSQNIYVYIYTFGIANNVFILSVLQGCLLSGPAMRAEEHEPRVRCENHQYQKTLLQR